MNDHDDLTALLHDTAAGITPRGSLEEIKERTMEQNKKRWILPAGAAAAVMVLLVGGVGWMLRDNDNDTDNGAGPTPLATPTATVPTPSATEGTVTEQATRAVRVYYVGASGDSERLYSEETRLTTDNADVAFARLAAQTAIDGDARDADYRTAWPRKAEVMSLGAAPDDSGEWQVGFAPGTDLSRPAGMTEESARLAVEQVVRSISAATGKPARVSFFHEKPTGDGGYLSGVDRIDRVFGIDTSRAVSAGSDDDVMAPVQITNLTDGQKVPAGPLTVSGVAAAFEANVQWELLVGGDAVVKNGFATAEECCTLSPYSFTIDGLEAGTYTLVVHDTDESGEGGPVHQDTKEIIVE